MLLALKNDRHRIPALLTAVLGAWLSWRGFGMPRPDGWASSPGIFPILIGLGLVGMAAALLVEGEWLRRWAGGPSTALQPTAAPLPLTEAGHTGPMPDGFGRTVAITLAIGVYIAVLSLLPFEVATTAFVAVAVRIFGERSIWKMLAFGVAVSLTLSLTFVLVLQTLLPGTESLVERLLS